MRLRKAFEVPTSGSTARGAGLLLARIEEQVFGFSYTVNSPKTCINVIISIFFNAL